MIQPKHIAYAAITGALLEIFFSVVGMFVGLFPIWFLVPRILLSPPGLGWLGYPDAVGFNASRELAPMAILATANAALYALVATVIWLVSKRRPPAGHREAP